MRLFRALSCVLSLCASTALAQPLSTAFTYQGELRASGSPSSGLHDFRFRLYDALSGGSQMGTTLCANDITLTAGRFTIDLDFLNQFSGSKRFLEVEVRADTGLSCMTSTGFTLLTPRQELTATPNAVYALTAATAASATTASTATNATQLNGQGAGFYQNAANLTSGNIPGARLSGAYPGLLQMDNPGNTFAGSGAGLTGLDAGNISSGTLSASRLPFPLLLSGNAPPHALRVDNTGQGANLVGIFGSAGGAVGVGVVGSATNADGTGVHGIGGIVGVRGTTSFASSDAVFGYTPPSAVFGRGVRGQVEGTDAFGVYGEALSTSGANFGGWFQSSSTSGIGVRGAVPATSGVTHGVLGESASPSGIGVKGAATADNGSPIGVLGDSASPNGIGVRATASGTNGTSYGLYATSAGFQGAGVLGHASGTAGPTYGVIGQSNSVSGTGVHAFAFSSTGGTIALRATCFSPGGNAGVFTGPGPDTVFIQNTGAGRGMHVLAGSDTAIWGESNGGFAGIHGNNANSGGYAVLGINSATTGSAFGVAGQSNSPGGFGLYAWGNSGASGTKSFRIDHPADPENKYLLHYSTESPEVLNAYSGTIRLDGAGEATVELPAYFARINKDPRYTLTPVGAPMPLLHVAREIDERVLAAGAGAAPEVDVPSCSFRIAGGAPGAKVSWEVKAVRNDPWVRQHGAPIEAEKEGRERGAYQHPELYGQPQERGMNHRAAATR